MKKNGRPINISTIRAMAFIALLILGGCQNDEEIQPTPVARQDVPGGDRAINSWIQENMEYWYLWEDDLPANPNKNQDPEAFFNSLLSDEDRFSWIQDNYLELIDGLNGVAKEAGYEFVLYRESEGSDQVVAQVTYIKDGSPADDNALRRGDLITHINETRLTISNYSRLLDATNSDYSIRYKPISADAQSFGDEKTMLLTPVVYQENPNYLDTVFTIGNARIGYYVYNFFSPGPDEESTNYDAEMDAVFSRFKAAGINELILDFRFNSGGSESSARNLASLIANGISGGSVFLTRQYNPQVDAQIKTEATLGAQFLTSNFLVKGSNIGNSLNRNRVYVLTSARTASASELVINALKPFMDVFLIGDTTYGKNVGSISIYEENDPDNTWGLQPIVVKVFNSLGQSDYDNGFTPNVYQKDNALTLFPLGDQRELLLGTALEVISGKSDIGSARKRDAGARAMLESSLDRKARSFRLTADDAFARHLRETLKNKLTQ